MVTWSKGQAPGTNFVPRPRRGGKAKNSQRGHHVEDKRRLALGSNRRYDGDTERKVLSFYPPSSSVLTVSSPNAGIDRQKYPGETLSNRTLSGPLSN